MMSTDWWKSLLPKGIILSRANGSFKAGIFWISHIFSNYKNKESSKQTRIGHMPRSGFHLPLRVTHHDIICSSCRNKKQQLHFIASTPDLNQDGQVSNEAYFNRSIKESKEAKHHQNTQPSTKHNNKNLHSRKQTWIPKMMVWKRWLLLNMAIFRIYVSFPGCMCKNIDLLFMTFFEVFSQLHNWSPIQQHINGCLGILKAIIFSADSWICAIGDPTSRFGWNTGTARRRG